MFSQSNHTIAPLPSWRSFEQTFMESRRWQKHEDNSALWNATHIELPLFMMPSRCSSPRMCRRDGTKKQAGITSKAYVLRHFPVCLFLSYCKVSKMSADILAPCQLFRLTDYGEALCHYEDYTSGTIFLLTIYDYGIMGSFVLQWELVFLGAQQDAWALARRCFLVWASGRTTGEKGTTDFYRS